MVFCWGTVLVGGPGPAYLPTATTWLYGSYHLATAHLPLALATAALLRAKQAGSRAATAGVHGAMFLIVLKQAWLGRESCIIFHIFPYFTSAILSIS